MIYRNLVRRLLPKRIRLQLSYLYHKTPSGKRKKHELIAEQTRRRKEIESMDAEILRALFDDRLVVRLGPFAGMKYVSRSHGSALLPKIAGSYEEPIHEWIEDVISNSRYTRILDIGCAEGYYAVGFAMRRPDISVNAYDIEAEAQRQTEKLASNNGVKNIEVRGICDRLEIAELGGPSTLIFCDIEGGELDLLDPAQIPILSHTDLIVETHDFLVPGAAEILLQRFASTHRVNLKQDYRSRLSVYGLTRVARYNGERVLDERRPHGMRWIMAEALANIHNSGHAYE